MANRNAPYGAQVLGNLANSGFNASVRKFVIPSSDNTATFVNDLVKLTGESNSAGIPYVIQAAAGDATVGAVQAFEVDRDNLSNLYREASTERVVYVNVDPYVLFNMQVTNGTLSTSDIGLNADIAVAAGSTSTGISGMSLDLGTKTASTAQVRIIEVAQLAGNEIGAYTQVLCMFNEHTFKGTTGV